MEASEINVYNEQNVLLYNYENSKFSQAQTQSYFVSAITKMQV